MATTFSGGQTLPAVGSQAYSQAASSGTPGGNSPYVFNNGGSSWTNPIQPTQSSPSNTTQPQIPVTSLNTQPANVPAYTPPAAVGNAQSVISNVGALNGNNGQNITPSQNALLNTTQGNVNANTDQYNAKGADISALIDQYAGMGADQAAQEQAAGVPGLQTQSNALTQQYNAMQATYNQQYNDILNRVGGTSEEKAQEIDALQQQHGYNLTNVGIQQSIAQNDYNNAETLIQHQITLKYSGLANQISYQQQFLANDKDLLSQSESQNATANLQVQQQMYTQSTYYAQLNASTSMDLLKTATTNGAPQDVITKMGQVIAAGGSSADVAAAGTGYTQNGNQLVQTGIDQNTGLPIYSSVNPNTGAYSVVNPANTFGQTGSASTTVSVGGQNYQMGATTTMGAYASATSTQVNGINQAVTTIQHKVGNVTDAGTAQLAINALSPNSPITGTMVMSAAQEYGVQPAAIIATMQAETQLGTDGSPGSKGNNYGNVGNSDSAMAPGGTGPVNMQPQQGVDAVAKQLSQRQIQSGQNDPAQPATTSLTPTQIAQATIKAAPALLQSAMSTLPSTGDVYIQQSKIPKGMESLAAIYAANNPGVPILTDSQVGDVQAANTALGELQKIQDAFTPIAPGSTLGGVADEWRNGWDALIQNGTGQQVTAYNNSTIAGALSIFGAVTGTTRTSNLITNITENSLPVLPKIGVTAFGSTSGDTLATGLAKINAIRDALNSQLQSILPNSSGAKLVNPSDVLAGQTSYTVGGQNYTLGSDGLYHLGK